MPMPKTSNPIVLMLCQAYLQQLYALHAQLKKQKDTLSTMVQTTELPYVLQQYQSILNNLQEQMRICEGLKNA